MEHPLIGKTVRVKSTGLIGVVTNIVNTRFGLLANLSTLPPTEAYALGSLEEVIES